MSTPSAAIGQETKDPGQTRRSLLRDGTTLLLKYGMVVVLIVMVIVTIILDSTFLDKNNLLNLLLQWAPVGLMAIGMTYVIISGGFDLSVGGIYAGAAVLYASMANEGIPIALCVLGVLAAGIAAGAVNGGIITRLEVNPFVATLGMGFILRGLALVLTSAAPIIVADQGFQAIGAGKWGPFPIPGVALILALLLFGFVLARTVYGPIDLRDRRWRRGCPAVRVADANTPLERIHAFGLHGRSCRSDHCRSTRLRAGRHRRQYRARRHHRRCRWWNRIDRR